MITHLKNIKLRTKLLISFGFVLLVLCIQGAGFISNLSKVNSEIDTVVYDIQPALLSSKQLSEELKQASTSLGFYLLTKEELHRTAYENGIMNLSTILEKLGKSPVIKELEKGEIIIGNINDRVANFAAYQEQINQLALGEKDTMIAAKYASENVNPIVMEISQMLSQAITAEEEEIATESRKQVLTDFNNLRYAWLSLVNEMRLFLAFRTSASKNNMSIYLEMVTASADKVAKLEDDLTFEQADAIEQVNEKLVTYKSNLESLITMHESDKWRVDSWLIRTEINPLLNSITSLISELNKQLEARSESATVAVNDTYIKERDRTIAGTAFILIIISAICWILIRSITYPLAKAVRFANSIAEGKLSDKIESDTTDETGQLLTALNTMRSKLRKRIESDRQLAAENGRVKQALDNVTGNVMIADADYNIIYMNNSVQAMFRDAEADLRKDLPNFDVDKLMGSSIDDFHKNKSHQRNLLANLKETYRAEMQVGGRTMRIVASPVMDTDGSRLGTVVEWLDRTQESAVEHEIQDIINSSKAGDLSKRIDLTIQEGFTRRLSQGINQLVDVCNDTINETVQVMGAIAQGDLTRKIETDYEGSFGQLKTDVNATIEKLTEVLGNINTSAESVMTSSQEIAQGNSNLSQRTEQQASSLEETASSMEEMTSTVKQNADNAQQANQLASGARGQAEQGGTVVNQAVSAMAEITESSNKIAAIIGVIDEIAFQTNLLALNAAVEAARAGEQGRGFAVVASEVRNLAGRSATAAKEIKDLIEDSVIKVGEGSKLVDDSGKTLEEIMTSVKKVSDIIAEIAAASQEQSEGIEQVNKAIAQMDEMTQQNAALVEEATAASESMGEQAGTLSTMVGFFKTSNSTKTIVKTERRKADRPWSAKAPQIEPVTAVKTANGNDAEWEEF